MAATQWLYSPVSTNGSEKTGILEIACCEMRNLARRQDTRVPGIDADDHRAGATDRFARLIRPLWTGDNAHRAQVTSATLRRERRLKQDGPAASAARRLRGQPAHLLILRGELGQSHPPLQALREADRASAPRGGVHEISDGNTPRRPDGVLDGSEEVMLGASEGHLPLIAGPGSRPPAPRRSYPCQKPIVRLPSVVTPWGASRL